LLTITEPTGSASAGQQDYSGIAKTHVHPSYAKRATFSIVFGPSPYRSLDSSRLNLSRTTITERQTKQAAVTIQKRVAPIPRTFQMTAATAIGATAAINATHRDERLAEANVRGSTPVSALLSSSPTSPESRHQDQRWGKRPDMRKALSAGEVGCHYDNKSWGYWI
jgi:hypothetical protein